MNVELSPFLVICLVAGLVLVINGMLVFLLTRPETKEQIRLLQKAAGSVRDPWRDEKVLLTELHDKVQELSQEEEDPSDG